MRTVTTSNSKLITMNHIYIHFPFCLKKCGYCSFYSVRYDKDLCERYVDKLCEEIEYYQDRGDINSTLHSPLSTLYFGGGTPSLLTPKQIERILSKFDLSNIEEIALEVNPATISPLSLTPNPLPLFKALGINRLSIGVQSMIDRELALLGRIHRVKDVLSLYDSGIDQLFDNISLDLIYGLPNQTLADVEYSVRELLKLNPSHLSIYCLSLEEDVPMYALRDQIPSDEVVAEMYYLIRDKVLGERDKDGWSQYELSSFCRDGKVSAHNMSYWSGKHYLGLGAGASGFLSMHNSQCIMHNSQCIMHNSQCIMHNGYRYTNSTLQDYMKGAFIKEKTPLTLEDIVIEYIITGLRKTEGISIKEFDSRFAPPLPPPAKAGGAVHSAPSVKCVIAPPVKARGGRGGVSYLLTKYSHTIEKLSQKGMIEVTDYVRLKPEYYFVSNEVLCEFI